MADILANRRIYSCDIVLSRKGVNTLRDVFVTRWKLDKNRFTIHAHGAKRTAASNSTPYGRAKNRRSAIAPDVDLGALKKN